MMKRFYKTNMSLEDMMSKQPTVNSLSDIGTNQVDSPNFSTSSTSFVNFTPTIRSRCELTATLLKNSPHCVSLLLLKSVEPFLPRGTEILLRSVSGAFKPGWLFDEVLNSFFWSLQERYPKVLYAASTSMLVLQSKLPSGRLWKDENIATKNFIITPRNPSGCHWALVGVDLIQKKNVYVDPLRILDVSTFVQLLATFLPQILLAKFGMSGFVMESPSHTLQTDHRSCGVLVCWYASLFVQGKPLTGSCDQNEMRYAIYDQIHTVAA